MAGKLVRWCIGKSASMAQSKGSSERRQANPGNIATQAPPSSVCRPNSSTLQQLPPTPQSRRTAMCTPTFRHLSTALQREAALHRPKQVRSAKSTPAHLPALVHGAPAHGHMLPRHLPIIQLHVRGGVAPNDDLWDAGRRDSCTMWGWAPCCQPCGLPTVHAHLNTAAAMGQKEWAPRTHPRPCK